MKVIGEFASCIPKSPVSHSLQFAATQRTFLVSLKYSYFQSFFFIGSLSFVSYSPLLFYMFAPFFSVFLSTTFILWSYDKWSLLFVGLGVQKQKNAASAGAKLFCFPGPSLIQIQVKIFLFSISFIAKILKK